MHILKILLIVYDNGSYIHYFPLGTARLAAMLQMHGHTVEIFSQDIYHYTDEDITDYLNLYDFDIVGIGVVGGYYQFNKIKSISEAINASKRKPYFVIGGHGPSAAPGFYLAETNANLVIIGEGEKALLHVADNLAVYRKQDQTIISFDEVKKLDDLPEPAYDLFNMEYYALFRYPGMKPTDRAGFIETSRGCPYKCTFCYRMMKGIRFHSLEYIKRNVQRLKNIYDCNYIIITDELAMVSDNRIKGLCDIMSNLNVNWWCNGRLNLATYDNLWLMSESGCKFINYGIESLNDKVLETINKNLTVEKITKGVRNTLAVGITPGLNIMWGNKGETYDDLRTATNFILRYGHGKELRTIRPVTPYPGSQLYNECIRDGIIENAHDFYYNKHKNSDLLSVNFTDIPDDKFHEYLYKQNNLLITSYFRHKRNNLRDEMRKLYMNNDTHFRGYRQT